MSNRLLFTTLLAALATLALSCGSKKSGGAKEYGGTVQFSHADLLGTDIVTASATFIALIEPEQPLTSDDLGLDVCPDAVAPTPTPAATPPPTSVTNLDVGATVTLTTGAETVTLDRQNSGGTANYSVGAQIPYSAALMDADWTVSFAGEGEVEGDTWESAFHTPGRMSVQSPSLAGQVSIGTTALDVTWLSSGADWVTITLSGFGTSRTCYARDDGAFTIPVGIITAADDLGILSITASTRSFHNLDGRRVELRADSGITAIYQR